jgi:hypothetical protein
MGKLSQAQQDASTLHVIRMLLTFLEENGEREVEISAVRAVLDGAISDVVISAIAWDARR